LVIARELGDKRQTSVALANLGSVAMEQGDYVTARSLFEEQLKLSRELGEQRKIASSLMYCGDLAYREGDLATAQSLCERNLITFREQNRIWMIAWAAYVLGRVAFRKGDYMQARAYYREGLIVRSKQSYRLGIFYCLERFAELAIAEDDPARASRLHGAAKIILEKIGHHPSPINLVEFERIEVAARDKLGQQSYEKLSAEGRSMTVEQAVAYALEA